MAVFIWDDKNTAHIAEHGITVEDAQYVVDHARSPYPMPHGDAKFFVRGRTRSGDYIQVSYVWESDAQDIDSENIDLLDLADTADSIYVIHARPLEEDEKRAFRKQGKRRKRR